MKSIIYTVLFVCAGMFLQNLSAQERTRTRTNPKDTQTTGLPDMSVRAQSKNETQTQNVERAPWVREIYRRVDLKEAENAPLYYPAEPIGERMNLFTILFKLIEGNKITAYEYLDGREIFTDQYKVGFKDLLDRFGILYTEKQEGAATQYVVEESDVPSAQVLSYLIKEAWYFEPSNSTIDIKLLAICPLLIDEGDFGESQSKPMFWVPYENIRPYISRKPVMISDVNNAMTYTLDDYFRKRMFKGEIIKTTNLLNYVLAQQFSTPEAVKNAQDSIESQLNAFGKGLWVYNDSTGVKNATVKPSKSKSKSVKCTNKKEKPKADKPAKSKAASSAGNEEDE